MTPYVGMNEIHCQLVLDAIIVIAQYARDQAVVSARDQVCTACMRRRVDMTINF